GAAHGVRIGGAVDPRESIVDERVHRANRGALTRPVLDVAMRADALHPVKSGGPASYQEPVAPDNEGKPPGPLNRQAELGAEGDRAVVEEIVGGQAGSGRVKMNRLRQRRRSLVRCIVDGAGVDGQDRVPAQLVSEAEFKTLSADAVVKGLGIVREATGII